MQWIYWVLLRTLDHRANREAHSPSAFEAFRRRALTHICLLAFAVTLVNGLLSLYFKRYEEILGLELPICSSSLMALLFVRKARSVAWIGCLYLSALSTCITSWMLQVDKTAFSGIYVWYPLLSCAAVLLCGRWIGAVSAAMIFAESLVVLLGNREHGFVLRSIIDVPMLGVTIKTTLVSASFVAFACMATVEWSRHRALQSSQRVNSLNRERASLSLLGDMARDISRNMQTPLATLQKRLDEAMHWDPRSLLQQRGSQLLLSMQQSLNELERLNRSLILFSQTKGEQERVTLRAEELLSLLQELAQEKATARGVSLDFTAEQPQLSFEVPAAASVFALASLVNKGIEAASGQEPAWVRLQLRSSASQLQIRITDSGPSLSFEERQAIQEQTSQRGAWDVNLRLTLDFLGGMGGRLALDPYSPDTCYVLTIPLRPLSRSTLLPA